jgi:hypothetical protein
MMYQPHPQMIISHQTILLREFSSGSEYALSAAYRALTVWEAGAKPEVPRGEKLLAARIKAQSFDVGDDCTYIKVAIVTGRWYRKSVDSFKMLTNRTAPKKVTV